MRTVLFLDDMMPRHQKAQRQFIGWKLVPCFSSSEAIEALKRDPPFDLVCLDHDLEEQHYGYGSDGERTGMDVARFIVGMPVSSRPKQVVIHSLNAAGASNMKAVLDEAGIRCGLVPFTSWK